MELRSYNESKNIQKGKMIWKDIMKQHAKKFPKDKKHYPGKGIKPGGASTLPRASDYVSGKDLDFVTDYLAQVRRQNENINENVHVWNGKNLDKNEVINAAMVALYTLNPNERVSIDAEEISRRLDCGIPIGFENNKSALNEYEGRLILMREV